MGPVRKTKEKLDLIAKSGANVVLSRLAIGDLATQPPGFKCIRPSIECVVWGSGFGG